MDIAVKNITIFKDTKALEAFYIKCFPKVKKYIRNNKGSIEDAKDIFHDAIHILYIKFKDKKLSEEIEIEGYLIGMCKNLWLQNLRKQIIKASDYLIDFPNYIDFEKNFEKNIDEALLEYMQLIGERCKNVLVDFYFNKISMKEIANKYGYKTEVAAKTRKYACIQILIEKAKSGLSQLRK